MSASGEADKPEIPAANITTPQIPKTHRALVIAFHLLSASFPQPSSRRSKGAGALVETEDRLSKCEFQERNIALPGSDHFWRPCSLFKPKRLLPGREGCVRPLRGQLLPGLPPGCITLPPNPLAVPMSHDPSLVKPFSKAYFGPFPCHLHCER